VPCCAVLCCPVSCSRLTQIFAVSQSYLYHAYAWLKLFNFSRSYNKNLTASDTQVRVMWRKCQNSFTLRS
jgi:hypothetical protein